MLFRTSLLLAFLSLAAAGGQGNDSPSSPSSASASSKGSGSRSASSKGSAKGSAKGSSKGDMSSPEGSSESSSGGVTATGMETGTSSEFFNSGSRVRGFTDPGSNTLRTAGAPIPLTETFIRSFDGSENAQSAPDAELLRRCPNNYPDGGVGDGLAGIMGTSPNARTVSNIVANMDTGTTPPKSRASDMLWQWGQFMDHDIGLTEETAMGEPFEVMSEDPNDTIEVIMMRRALFHWSDSTPAVREQLNEITGFLDASMVYGHNETRANALRDTGNFGRMLMTDQGLLPGIIDTVGLGNAFPDFLSANAPDQFTGGDIRVNEQLGLLAIHTLWVREHNRRAGQLANAFPDSTDEQLFQMARKIVIAEIQAITYKEFLPILIGSAAPDLDAYDGFQPNVNPGVDTEFSACAFRVGHTFLSEELLLHDGVNPIETRSLVDLFFTPGIVRENPLLIDQVLIGQTVQAANSADVKVISAVRNNLFGAPVSRVGRDLVVFNIMRGRDHGLQRYNNMRIELGLEPKFTFDDVTSDPEIADRLGEAYPNGVAQCDPWICGLAEDAVGGGELGEMFSEIISEQFQRFMDGDEFFYLNDPDVHDPLLVDIGIDVDTITLADVINANTIGGVGPDAMLA